MLTLICPKCGKEKNKDVFMNNVCMQCYLSEKDFVTLKRPEFTLCKSCFRIRSKNKWISFSEDELESMVEDNLKIEFPEYKIQDIQLDFYKNKVKAVVVIEGKLDEHIVEQKREFVISLKMQNCDDCYKTMSDFFQSILQVRYDDEAKEKYAKVFGKKEPLVFMTDLMRNVIKERRKKGDFLAYVYKVTETKHGFDMQIGSKQQAMEFLKEIKQLFYYERKESNSLVGIDQRGKEKLRHTFLIRLK